MTSRYIPPHLRGNNKFVVANPNEDVYVKPQRRQQRQYQSSNYSNRRNVTRGNYQSSQQRRYNNNRRSFNYNSDTKYQNNVNMHFQSNGTEKEMKIKHAESAKIEYEDRKYSKLKLRKYEHDQVTYHQISTQNTEEIESNPLFDVRNANYKQIMTEHLVCGYIGEIEKILQTQQENVCNNIIPVAINRICYHFYYCPPKFMFTNSNIDSFSRSFHAFDLSILSKNVSIIPKEILQTQTIMPCLDTYTNNYALGCYIPNIFYHSPLMKQILLTKNKQIDDNIIYDAILAKNSSNNVSFLIFNGKKLYDIKRKDQTIYRFNTDFSINSTALFCDQYGIIYSDQNHIYQIDLDKISNIHTCRTTIVEMLGHSKKLIYLKERNSILIFNVLYPTTECSIYDLNTKKLKLFTPCVWIRYSSISSACCNSNNLNEIYVISDIGETFLYNMEENKWTDLGCDIDKNARAMAHMWQYEYESDVIYCISLYQKTVKCSYLDTQQAEKKWIVYKDDMKIDWKNERISLFT